MIRLANVTKRYGKLQVLHDVNLDCSSGQCIALIGPNGCGKTTVIKSILGMVIPDSGNIYFQDQSIKNGFKYRHHIGYMPQIGHYPQNMTIGQVIEMIRSIRGVNMFDEDLLNAYRLKEMYHKRMNALSGGTIQKVSASIAFLFNPDVLILDEPTAGLDPLAAEILKEKIIAERQRNKLILITSHLLSELDDLVSQLVFMQEGNIVFHKDIELLKQETGENKVSGVILKSMKAGIA